MNNPIEIEKLIDALKHLIPPTQLYYFKTIDSTNLFLKKNPQIKTNTFSFCIAEEQSAGRGRLGKIWISPKGGNIYCSIGVNIATIKQNLSPVALVTGLSVLKTLKPYLSESKLYLKWPNDILCENRKLSGILLEKEQQILIIGIGINLYAPLPSQPLHADKPWGSISQFTNTPIDRTTFLIELIEQFSIDFNRFLQSGLTNFIEEWLEVDYLMNKKIKLLIQHQEHIGFARGINEDGLLKFEDLVGEMHYLNSGDASLLNFL